MKKTAAIAILIIIGTLTGCGTGQNNSHNPGGTTTAEYVTWNKTAYIFGKIYNGKLGKQIGVVERYVNGNSSVTNVSTSNFAHKGRKIYAMPGVSTSKRIIVEIKKNTYDIANNSNQYK